MNEIQNYYNVGVKYLLDAVWNERSPLQRVVIGIALVIFALKAINKIGASLAKTQFMKIAYGYGAEPYNIFKGIFKGKVADMELEGNFSINYSQEMTGKGKITWNNNENWVEGEFSQGRLLKGQASTKIDGKTYLVHVDHFDITKIEEVNAEGSKNPINDTVWLGKNIATFTQLVNRFHDITNKTNVSFKGVCNGQLLIRGSSYTLTGDNLELKSGRVFGTGKITNDSNNDTYEGELVESKLKKGKMTYYNAIGNQVEIEDFSMIRFTAGTPINEFNRGIVERQIYDRDKIVNGLQEQNTIPTLTDLYGP